MDAVITPIASTSINTFCIPSLQKLGFQYYQEQSFEHGLVSLPAFMGIRISYLHKGVSQSAGVLQAGTLLLNGYTPAPLYGEVTDFSMASICLHFTLLYRLTGIMPRDCRFPIKVHPSDPIHTLLLPLFFTPQEQWEKLSLHAIRHTESKIGRASLRTMERVDLATKVYHGNPLLTFYEIASQIGVSYRQLQRDFSTFLGMTPREYERADRFRRAVENLKILSPAQASIASGYWDQAHMNKEFKEISGRTPRQIMQLNDIYLPQLHNSR
jgi:AraC-like DNA-binding protein